MTRLYFLLSLLILSVGFAVAQPGKDPLAQPGKDPFPLAAKAPMLEFKDMDGKLISLEHLKGNVIVLNFWNMGCTGCEQERETLNWLSDSLRNQPIKFVSITLNKKEKISAWLEKHPVSFEFVGNVDFMGIAGPSFFNYRCMPTTVVIDQQGMVRYNQCRPIIGQSDGRKFAALLTK